MKALVYNNRYFGFFNLSATLEQVQNWCINNVGLLALEDEYSVSFEIAEDDQTITAISDDDYKAFDFVTVCIEF